MLMNSLSKMTLRAMLMATMCLLTAPMAQAATAAPVKAKNVVLVHGAWADGSSWAGVIPLLQKAGLHVTAVQNPLSSLDDSNAATRRALALAGWADRPRRAFLGRHGD
jgi:ABC-type proline/glycine betaine transport system substrate-binding protein